MNQRSSTRGVICWITATIAITFVSLIFVFPSSAHMAQGDSNPQPMIVGGQSTTPGEWPSMVNVRYFGSHHCGGTLLSLSWVVTAAHCVSAGITANDGIINEITVVLGDYDQDRGEGTEQFRNVDYIVTHPNENPYTYDNDIALFKLSQTAILNSNVNTLRMATTSDSAYYAPGQMATVIGWGKTREGGTDSARLLKVLAPLVSYATCNAAVGGITDNMICAGYKEGGRDACQGDSGGPLMISVGGEWKLVGIVSWGRGCARPDQYGVYTYVPNFVSWINSYIQ